MVEEEASSSGNGWGNQVVKGPELSQVPREAKADPRSGRVGGDSVLSLIGLNGKAAILTAYRWSARLGWGDTAAVVCDHPPLTCANGSGCVTRWLGLSHPILTPFTPSSFRGRVEYITALCLSSPFLSAPVDLFLSV